MLIPISWLKRYVEITILDSALAEKLTMAGIEIGSITRIGENWARDKVVVGNVLKVEPHPNADRLTIATVDLSNDEFKKVVCGGPNIREGQKIAFAHEGAILYNTHTNKTQPLTAAKIRGINSPGMVCSEIELGLGKDHSEILVLPEDAPTGTPLFDYMGDSVLDAEVTPNRPDCLSILGIAREVAALTGKSVHEPNLKYVETGDPVNHQISIDIANIDMCKRYSASVIKGVKITESPDWLQKELRLAGQRTINNVVDITNYVMLECGQPLHAFDYDRINDNKIIVRPAKTGEKLSCLDGELRKLSPPMLTISDSQNPLALAGIMGGTDSEVSDKTTSVVIESANFDPINTRRTAKELGINTEASYRFERNIRPGLVLKALKRATHLILEMAGGEACKGIVDVYPNKDKATSLIIPHGKFKKVLGVNISKKNISNTLLALGFDVSLDGEKFKIRSPYWRVDIKIAEDIVEEVARIIGYDEIPTKMLSSPIPHKESNYSYDLRETIRDIMIAGGMHETISYSATSKDNLRKVAMLDNGPNPVRITNPITRELEVMRTTLRGSILKTLGSNINVSQNKSIRLFEIGKIYIQDNASVNDKLPEEKEVLIGVLAGPRHQPSWAVKEKYMNFFDAKGVVERVFTELGLAMECVPCKDPVMHPGKTAQVLCDGKNIGVLGEIHSDVLNQFDIKEIGVSMFEINLESLYEIKKGIYKHYSSISRFPESTRDFALVFETNVLAADIQQVINRHNLVKSSTPVDVYSSESLSVGKKSIAFRVVFQSTKSTLTKALIDKAQSSILKQLQAKFGIELRN